MISVTPPTMRPSSATASAGWVTSGESAGTSRQDLGYRRGPRARGASTEGRQEAARATKADRPLLLILGVDRERLDRSARPESENRGFFTGLLQSALRGG